MPQQKPKILCVDDDPTSRELLAYALSSEICQVIMAETGRQALDIIAQENIDLVLLDVVMPGMDGFAVCKAIKGDDRTRNIPVVMITALISKEDRIKGIEAGAEDFLSKPFDPAEVRARVRMLLKVKNQNERRTGDVLIELGLINDQQLREALKLSKERNIKVGEAIYAMGALSRDTIYWGLSNQLRMTYVELSPEMVDKELIREFPLEALKRLQCLPLYETNAEIHFAVADPTDKKSMETIRSLRPGKAIQLYLGLPEKIADILGYFEREQPAIAGRPVSFLLEEGVETPRAAASATSPNDLAVELLTMPEGAARWLERTAGACRLLSRSQSSFETIREYPVEAYAAVEDWLKPGRACGYRGGEVVTVLSDGLGGRAAAFQLRPVEAIGRTFVRIDRLPTFSAEAFERAYPKAARLVAETGAAFEEHRPLVVGCPDSLLIKQLCYSFSREDAPPHGFPMSFFLESAAEVYLPEATQLSVEGRRLGSFLESVWEEGAAPFVFYEAGSTDPRDVADCLSALAADRANRTIVYVPCVSAEAMRSVLRGWLGPKPGDFRAVFIDASRVEPVS